MVKPVFVLNGPNLNLLGSREPEIYGRDTLADVERRTKARGQALGLPVEFRQTNAEGELVGWVQEARAAAQGVVINAGAYSHTSIAILDALLATGLPIVEVHLSNLFRREDFRQHSFVSQAAGGLICGFGAKGYELAIEAMAELIRAKAAG